MKAPLFTKHEIKVISAWEVCCSLDIFQTPVASPISLEAPYSFLCIQLIVYTENVTFSLSMYMQLMHCARAVHVYSSLSSVRVYVVQWYMGVISLSQE